MSTDPLFSRGVLKAIGILFVAAVLGGGAYALAGGGIDLPDINLPETDTGSVTNLSDTNLESTTIGDQTQVEAPEPPPTTNPFTSASLTDAIAKVRGELGGGAKLQQLTVNDVQTQFIVQRGKDVEAYSVRADDGSVDRQDATITISGNATLDDFAFALDGVDPAAIDRMLAQAKKLSGAGDFKPSTLGLERDLSAGLQPPEWTINAQARGRYLTLKAKENGKGVHKIGGGTEIPQGALDAQKLNECIQNANGDIDAIQGCVEQLGAG